MKKSELTKMREKTADELTGMAKELRETLLKGRFAAALEGKGMGIKTRGMRRQIARIECLLSQRAHGAPAAAPAPSAKKPAAPRKPAGTKPAAKAEKKPADKSADKSADKKKA